MRRKGREERERFERILERDKEEMTEASKRSALADFKRVASEYFELEGEPTLQTGQGAKGNSVLLSFDVRRIRNFTVLK